MTMKSICSLLICMVLLLMTPACQLIDVDETINNLANVATASGSRIHFHPGEEPSDGRLTSGSSMTGSSP